MTLADTAERKPAATRGRSPARPRRARQNLRHDEFIRHYLAGAEGVRGNATQAAIAAGYTTKAARQQATWLLSRPAIQRAIATYHDKADVKAGRVLEELKRIGFSDLRDYVTWGPGGITLRASSELTPEQAAAVAEVAEHETVIPTKGGEPIIRRTVRIKLHPKPAALQDLARITGLLKDGLKVLQINDHRQTLVLNVGDLSDEQLVQLEGFLRALPAPRDPAPDPGRSPG
jgi:phage terminase small subunit